MERTIKTLCHPPLLETALSIIMKIPMLEMNAIGNFVAKVAPDFKMVRELVQQTFTLTPDSISSQSPAPKPFGRQYTKDKNLVLLIQNRSLEEVEFVFSVLPPYTNWEDLYNSARPILDAFIVNFHVACINRIAVRSIDRLFAPYDGCAITDIIKTVPPDIGALSTPFVHGFNYHDMMYYKDFDLCATVIRATSPASKDPRFSVILDSDVSTPPKRSYVADDINTQLRKIVELKDIIFFNSVGDKCMEGLA